MNSEAELQIVLTAQCGNVDSFAKLYKMYYAPMVWLAYSILTDRSLAEDVAQETFVLACEGLPRLKQPKKFASWLAAICRNTVSQMLKRRKKQIIADNPGISVEQRNDHSLEQKVREAIAALPRLYREPVVLRYYNGMNYQQLGSVLNINTDKVKGRLFRARRKIAKYLKSRGLSEVNSL